MVVRPWARLAALLALFWIAAPASATWRRAESANFIVYSQSGEQSLRERVTLLEDYDRFLRTMTQINDPPSPNKLHVYIVRNHDALESVRDIPKAVAGFYTASGAGIAAFADESAGDGDEILFHEIAHHFMMQYRPLAYPPWYVEGFAEYVMTAKFEKGAILFGEPSRGRAYMLVNQSWLPLDRVLFFPPPTKADDMGLYYAESWLLVHYLLRDPARKAKLVDYLTATAHGEPAQAAFQRVFAEDPKQLQKELEQYSRGGMTYSRLKRHSAEAKPAMAVATLPSSADDLLLLKAAMDVGVDPRQEEAQLGRVRTAAARYPADPFANRVLAEAEALYGDGAAADRLLGPLLAASPNDGELLYLNGMRYLRAGLKDEEHRADLLKQAQLWFSRAHKADPNQFQSLVRYAQSLSGSRAFDSENSIEVLLLAHQLAPQVQEISMNAGKLLLAKGDYDLAATLLGPVAYDPHGGGYAEAAKRLLETAREKKAAAAAPAGASKP